MSLGHVQVIATYCGISAFILQDFYLFLQDHGIWAIIL